MSKNPFVNSKSRKRRKTKTPVPKPKEKLFCPRTMVRYDGSPNEYNTVWVCKMCLIWLLSENAVREHIIKCNASTNKDKAKPTKKNEDTGYNCEFCSKVFSRRVTLKKHLEVHEKSSSSINSESSDNEVEDDPLETENANDALITEDANDNNDEHGEGTSSSNKNQI